jgi:hypothetical protein
MAGLTQDDMKLGTGGAQRSAKEENKRNPWRRIDIAGLTAKFTAAAHQGRSRARRFQVASPSSSRHEANAVRIGMVDPDRVYAPAGNEVMGAVAVEQMNAKAAFSDARSNCW